MANLIPEETPRFRDPDSLEAQLSEYVKIKSTIDVMDSRAKEIRDRLFQELDGNGEEDDKGNLQLVLPLPIDGVVRLEKQRRVTRKIDEQTSEEIIAELGLEEEVYEVKRVINEDALMAAYYEGKITEEQLDAMYPASVTWALRTLKK